MTRSPGFFPTLLPSHLQKCVLGHKWHWYPLRIGQSHAIITHLVHSLPIPASFYMPHSLDIVGALRLVGVVPSCHKSLKWRRNSSHGFCPTLLPSGLQKCIFGHKWHWYAFCIGRSHATITYLVHSLPIPASSYKPHSLAIAVHCVLLQLFPHFLNPWNEGGTTPT